MQPKEWPHATEVEGSIYRTSFMDETWAISKQNA